MKINFHKDQTGFTLVELLIVAGMLGIVMGAIYSLYITHQRTAYTQEEVVDVQQNLRIAMESISRDIRMSGFLVPDPGILNPPNDRRWPVGAFGNGAGILQPLPAPNDIASDTIALNTASPSGGVGRIVEDTTAVVSPLSEIFFAVDENAYFSVEDTRQVVRIIAPRDASEPVSAAFTVEGVGTIPASCGGQPAPCLKLRSLGGSGSTVNFSRSMMIVRTGTTVSETRSGRIEYSLVGGPGSGCPSTELCIQRSVNGTPAIIANKIAGLQFRYQMDDNTETDAPADLQRVRAVRVTIFGQTYSTQALSDGVAKERSITSVVKSRNRKDEPL